MTRPCLANFRSVINLDRPGDPSVFSEQVRADAAELIARYPKGQSRSALLPLLHLVQSEQGYVTPDGIAFCSDTLGLTKAQVAAVATFYTMYKRSPTGEFLVSVCTNTLCGMLGGDEIFAALKDDLGVGHNQTSADGTITLEHAECLAACDYAPVVTVNYEFFDNQTVDSARDLVGQLRAGERPAAHPRRAAVHVQGDRAADRRAARRRRARARGQRQRRPDRGRRQAGHRPRRHRAVVLHRHLAAGQGEEGRAGARAADAAGRRRGRRRERKGPDQAPAHAAQEGADRAADQPARRAAEDGRVRPEQPGPAGGREAAEDRLVSLTPVLTKRFGTDQPWKIDNYERLDGYAALRKAFAMAPDELITLVKDSNLRGRGGAGFPTGMKWSFIPQPKKGEAAKPHYVVVNADEGEPGTCRDMPLMMNDPHSLIEGIIIACYAVRAYEAFIYIRGEAVHAIRRVTAAVREAGARGYLGTDILGSGFNLRITVHSGAGSYECGEETALLDSLEGRRGQPRLKPPFPATNGLYDAPTVVNNVGTLASVPYIVLGGADWFKLMGPEGSPGPCIYSLSGRVKNPGQYEAPMGTTLRELLGARRRDEPRQGAEVLDAGRLVHPAVHARAPRHPARLRRRGQGRLDERHVGRDDLRRGRLRGARGQEVVGVLRARVVRQVHAVPRGHLLVRGHLRAARGAATAPRRTSTRCSTCPTTSWAARSARSATAPPARSRPRSSSSATSTSRTSRARAARSRRPASWPERGHDHRATLASDMTKHPPRKTWSPSPSTGWRSRCPRAPC